MIPATDKSFNLTQLLRNRDGAAWAGVDKIRVILKRKLSGGRFGDIGEEQIEDILKTAIEKLLMNLESYSFLTYEKVAAFLYTTARRLAVDHLRTESKEGGSSPDSLKDIPDFLKKYFRIFARSEHPEEKFKEVKTAICNGWYDDETGSGIESVEPRNAVTSRDVMQVQLEKVFNSAVEYRERRVVARSIPESFTNTEEGDFFKINGDEGINADSSERSDGERIAGVLRDFIGGLEKKRAKFFVACILNEERISDYWRKISENRIDGLESQNDLYAEAGDLILKLSKEFKKRDLNLETVDCELIEYSFGVVAAELSLK